jgi:hypothetical protein
MEEKYCPDCKTLLPISAFTRDARRPDGLSFYCVTCRRARDLASKRKRNGPPRHRGAFRPIDVPEGMKWCPECFENKPFGEFPRNKSARSGLGVYCKPCHNKITRANKEKHGGARNYHLRRRYGITAEHYDRMLAEQSGVCAICCEAPAVHVDHDHVTKRIRGLLCFNCNGALGQFRDRLSASCRLRRAHRQSRGYPHALRLCRPVPCRGGCNRRWVGSLMDTRPSEEPR